MARTGWLAGYTIFPYLICPLLLNKFTLLLHALLPLLALRDLEKQVIAQSINTGHDVSNIQFDLQMGNGGTGAFNNCAGDG